MQRNKVWDQPGRQYFMAINANFLFVIVSLLSMLSSAMESPNITELSENNETCNFTELPTHLGLQNPENAELIDKMWEHLRVHFQANKQDADEFWWQTAVDKPDRILERFLQGNARNVIAAVQATTASLKWRREYKVRDLIYMGESKSELIPRECFESGKGIFWGYDKDGYLVIYLYPRKHMPHPTISWNHTQQHIVYQTELGRRLFKEGRDKVTVLIDLEGLSLWYLDVNCALFVATNLRHYYPEAINQIILINMNSVYSVLYGLVSPVVQFIMKKIREVRDKEDLQQVFQQEELLTEFGGSSTYQYHYVPPSSGSDDSKSESLKENPELSDEYQSLLKKADELTAKFYVSGDVNFKCEICGIYKQLDKLIYPGDLYSRIGVIQSDGSVKW